MENYVINFSLIILFLPLLAFAIVLFAGNRLPRKGDWVSILSIFVTLVLSSVMFVNMLLGYESNFRVESSFTWFAMSDFRIELGFLVDNFTIIMLLVVSLISTCTHIFSTQYLKGDINYKSLNTELIKLIKIPYFARYYNSSPS